MKTFVMELLDQKGLTHLFNDKEFNTYRKKVTKDRPDYNRYYAALHVMDMFIINAPVNHGIQA